MTAKPCRRKDQETRTIMIRLLQSLYYPRTIPRACLRVLAESLLSSAFVSHVCAQAPARKSGTVPLPMQTPTAQSVGTSTNLKAAAQVLLSGFDQVKKHKKDRITDDDLRSLAQSAHQTVREAARFFAVSPVDRELCGGKQGITPAGLTHCVSVASSLELDGTLEQLQPASGGTSTPEQKGFYTVLLRDPGVPAVLRAKLVARLSDGEMLAIVGHPNAQGNAKDKADETAAFLYLARLSWLGTAEAEAISSYKVPYVMLRGSKDRSVSYWDGHQVSLSEKMLTGGTGTVSDEALQSHIGIFAHESGHAIFGLSGLSRTVDADIKRHHLTPGMGGIINEAVAGIMQNRAHVAAQGYGHNKETDANLVLAHDVEKNIVNDQTFYAKDYHVNTAVARSQIKDILEVLADSVVPYFQSRFGLLGDPQLAQTLPNPRQH